MTDHPDYKAIRQAIAAELIAEMRAAKAKPKPDYVIEAENRIKIRNLQCKAKEDDFPPHNRHGRGPRRDYEWGE